MNRQPDKIFRDKLQDYQPPVSSDAWGRVSSNLRHGSQKLLWMKVAAGLLILAVAGILLVRINTDSAQLLVTDKTKPSREQSPIEEKLPIEEQRAEKTPTREEKSETIAPLVTRAPFKNRSRLQKDAEAVPPMSADVTKREEITMAATDAPQDDILKEQQEVPVIVKETPVTPRSQAESTTIVFTSTEVEKYLTKKTAQTKATSTEKEASTWQKLLDKAYDLKNNQDPLGNLRQKKNEILALNFKNDNQGHENK